MPVKMCEKCRKKPACVKSPLFPKLCYECGIGPHTDKINRASYKRQKAKNPELSKEVYQKWLREFRNRK